MARRPSASSRQAGAAETSELPARALELLVADDLEGYRRLFGRIESIEDVHRRYWAGASLVERGLKASAELTPARLPALLATLAASTLELLEREPSEPRLLGYAGEILYELSSLDAAEAMLSAARRLDPQLDRVERNRDALAVRRRLQQRSAG